MFLFFFTLWVVLKYLHLISISRNHSSLCIVHFFCLQIVPEASLSRRTNTLPFPYGAQGGGDMVIHQIHVYCSLKPFIFIFNELWRQVNMKLLSEAM